MALAAGHLGARGAQRKVAPGKARRAGPAERRAHDPETERAEREVEAWPRPVAGPEASGLDRDRPGQAARRTKGKVPGARDKLDGPGLTATGARPGLPVAWLTATGARPGLPVAWLTATGARPGLPVAWLTATGARPGLPVAWLTATGARPGLPVAWLTATGARRTVAAVGVASPGPRPLAVLGAIPLAVLGTSAGPKPRAVLAAARPRPRAPGARVTTVPGDLLFAPALAGTRSDAEQSPGRVVAAPPEAARAEWLGLALRSVRSAQYLPGGGASRGEEQGKSNAQASRLPPPASVRRRRGSAERRRPCLPA